MKHYDTGSVSRCPFSASMMSDSNKSCVAEKRIHSEQTANGRFMSQYFTKERDNSSIS